MPAQGAEKGGQDVINYTTALVAWVLKIAMIILTTTSKKRKAPNTDTRPSVATKPNGKKLKLNSSQQSQNEIGPNESHQASSRPSEMTSEKI